MRVNICSGENELVSRDVPRPAGWRYSAALAPRQRDGDAQHLPAPAPLRRQGGRCGVAWLPGPMVGRPRACGYQHRQHPNPHHFRRTQGAHPVRVSGGPPEALSALTPWPDPAAQCHVEVVLSISALRPPGQRQVRMSPCARGWIGRRPWAIGEDPAGSGSGEESVCADVSDPPCAVPVHEDVGESMEQSLVCPGRNGI